MEVFMSYVTVIGAAIMDIIAKSNSRLINWDSNPGKAFQSCGGVGRNIAENLARLSTNVKLVAALGTDNTGKQLLEVCNEVGIDTSLCQVISGGASSIYIAILDNDGEMAHAIVDDSAKLNMLHIKEHAATINKSEIIVVDTNLAENEIAAILDMFPGKDIFADAISVTKAVRLKKFIGRFHTIKMNKFEATAITGMEIIDENSLKIAAEYLLLQGLKRIVISLGSEGVFYKTQTEELRHKPTPIDPVNATGAGDALMAGIVYSSLKKKSAEETLKFSHAMAYEALMSKSTVSPLISERRINDGIYGAK